MTRTGSPSTDHRYSMETVPVFAMGVQLDVVDRIPNEDLRKFSRDYAGTDKITFVHFVLMTGHEILVQLRASDIDTTSTEGQILITGIIANGGKPAAVMGSLFNANDGWLRVEKIFEPRR